MNTTAAAATRGRTTALELPLDVTTWVEPVVLWRWIVEEIDTLAWSNPELQRFLQANPAFQPRMLLCLLVYAYARGIYDADEVGRLAVREEVQAEFTDAAPPGGRAVTRFRRENRGLIRWGLVQTFKRVVRARYLVNDTYFPPGLKRYLVQVATTRLDVARTMIRGTEEA